jgi:hypothetical protein
MKSELLRRCGNVCEVGKEHCSQCSRRVPLRSLTMRRSCYLCHTALRDAESSGYCVLCLGKGIEIARRLRNKQK